MTAYERIRQQFNATATCRHGNRPRLEYEPGCAYVECDKQDACKCRMLDGDGSATSAFLIEWHRKFAR